MGYETSEVRFHGLLALMSGRTMRQFSDEDFHRLAAARRDPLSAGSGEHDAWAQGVLTILRLIDVLETRAADVQLVVKKLDELGTLQREKILRHLEMFLEGPLKDQVWSRELEQVRGDQLSNDRENRVWIFFQPKPAAARVRQPVPVATTTREWLVAFAAAAIGVAASGYLGWELLLHGNAWAMLAYVASIVGGCVCAVNRLEWRFRISMRRAWESRLRSPRRRGTQAPPGGFARKVDRLFTRYFARYLPDGIDRTAWLDLTARVRGYLRDEIVEIYREKGVSAEQVAWLIRFRVWEVKRSYRAGELTAYRYPYRVRSTTKATYGIGLTVLALGGIWAIVNAWVADPPGVSVVSVVAVLAGWPAVRTWLSIVLERRRFAADKEESGQRLAAAKAAYERWCAKLAPKPSDEQMATWLDCDRAILLDEAMQRYSLPPSHVIAYAFIEAPAAFYRRARVLNGPWRYSRYHLLAFLLTADGVRQVSADLDFTEGTLHDWIRTNYRFDAVAAVRVSQTDNYEQTFELGLVNGEWISVRVSEASTEEQLQEGEDVKSLSNAALDAAGLTTTLEVLEGIAAEGKERIRHQNPLRQRRTQTTGG